MEEFRSIFYVFEVSEIKKIQNYTVFKYEMYFMESVVEISIVGKAVATIYAGRAAHDGVETQKAPKTFFLIFIEY